MARENEPRPMSSEIGWGERLGGSIRGIVTGVILFLVGTGFLWWNEGKAVKTGDLIAEVAMKVEPLSDINKLDPNLNGKLVYATGNAVSEGEVRDNDFEISLNAIKLSRSVKYYQWVEISHTENKNNAGGSQTTTTTYTYAKKWVEFPVDSSGFKEQKGHQNTIKADIKFQNIEANKVSFGAYSLNKKQIGEIKGRQKLSLSQFSHLNDLISTKFATDLFKIYDNKIYFGYDQNKPQIGDVEISFEYIPNEVMVSLVAKINNDTFTEYKATNGKFFSRLDVGSVSIDEMVDKEETANTIWTWVFRFIGFFIVSAGIKMILAPIVAVAYILPFLGGITSGIVSVIGSLLGLAWSLIIIAISWISYRPVLSYVLLGVAVLSILAVFLFRKKKPEQGQPNQNWQAQQNYAQQAQNYGQTWQGQPNQNWQQSAQPQNYAGQPQGQPQAPQQTQGWQPQNNAQSAGQATQGWQPPKESQEPNEQAKPENSGDQTQSNSN